MDKKVVSETLTAMANKVKEDFHVALSDLDKAVGQTKSNTKIDEAIQKACKDMLKGLDTFKKTIHLDQSDENPGTKNYVSGILEEIKNELTAGLNETKVKFDKSIGEKIDDSMKQVNEALVNVVDSYHKAVANAGSMLSNQAAEEAGAENQPSNKAPEITPSMESGKEPQQPDVPEVPNPPAN